MLFQKRRQLERSDRWVFFQQAGQFGQVDVLRHDGIERLPVLVKSILHRIRRPRHVNHNPVRRQRLPHGVSRTVGIDAFAEDVDELVEHFSGIAELFLAVLESPPVTVEAADLFQRSKLLGLDLRDLVADGFRLGHFPGLHLQGLPAFDRIGLGQSPLQMLVPGDHGRPVLVAELLRSGKAQQLAQTADVEPVFLVAGEVNLISKAVSANQVQPALELLLGGPDAQQCKSDDRHDEEHLPGQFRLHVR